MDRAARKQREAAARQAEAVFGKSAESDEDNFFRRPIRWTIRPDRVPGNAPVQ
jgi:hypothetical protein